ncbi:hypothetical protein L484_012857 [Morus notabilis]|uniref:Uncharacterized protein n=1 Tax=Morus notabilis TaxID=981085 RepID=W9QV27_9ROSA|nr:hypothetical protein L484_012857 [Morus notabilis]
MGKVLRKNPKKPPISVFQADERFVKKILSRNSSVGNCSSHLQNFRTPAEVPFNWESQPGKPKDPPTGEFFRPPPVDLLPSPEARAPRYVPARSPPRADGTVVSQQTLRVRLWKKLIERGHKTVKKVRAKAPSLTAARGSVLFGGIDGLIMPKCEHHRDHFCSSIASSSFNSSSTSFNGCLALEGSSKLQNFARGCIKWAF